MPELLMSALTSEDYDDLIDLWREAELPYRPGGRDTKGAISAQMALPNCRFFAARGEPGGRLLGAVIVNHEGRKGWINRMAVRPSAQRSGIARALVQACERWLIEENILVIAALVEGDNHASQALFAACGYERDDSLVYFRKPAKPDV